MKVGKICLLFFMSASILLAGCGNAKNKKGEDNLVGNDKDDHGCIASAGYTWSEVRKDCIRLWEQGVRMESVADKANTAFIVFARCKWNCFSLMISQTKYWIVAPCPLVVMRGM